MPKTIGWVAYVVVALGLGLPAQAATGDAAMQLDLNHVWVMTATALVLLMQCGFMLFEAGNVRSKNTVNVAQKNLVDSWSPRSVSGLWALR